MQDTKNDYYIFDNYSGVVYAFGLTIDEAMAEIKTIAREYPNEVHYFSVTSVSADPKTAARQAFSHIAKW